MKKGILFTFLATFSLLLTGCSEPLTSETGYDLEALDVCIDAMVEENSNQACETSVKEAIIEEYATSFMDNYSDGNTVFSDSDLTYSNSKDGSIERIEYWFQFSQLPSDVSQTEYDSFKSIIQTMSTELKAINDVPEFVFTGEFMFTDDIVYKYHHYANETIAGDIVIYGLLSTFETTFVAFESFIQENANDEDLILQEVTIVNSDHNVKITIDPLNDTYSYQIYYTKDDAVMTTAEVETIIQTSFNYISFTHLD